MDRQVMEDRYKMKAQSERRQGVMAADGCARQALQSSVYCHADAPEWASVRIKVPPFTFGEKVRRAANDAICLTGSILFGMANLVTGAKRRAIRAPRKILLIRRGGIGDLVLITPLVRALKASFPSCRIQLLTNRQAISIFSGNPYIDEIMELPKGKKEWFAFIRKMRAEQIDTALILHRIFVVSLLALFMGIPQRIGYRWKRHGFALTRTVPFDASRAQVVQISELMEVFGKPAPGGDTEIYLSEDEKSQARQSLEKLHYDPSKLLIAIHPGTSEVLGVGQSANDYARQQKRLQEGEDCRTPRRWPAQHFSQLADLLTERMEAQVLVLQGPADELAVEEMIAGMRHTPFGVSPKLSLKSFTALLGLCDLVIANDSGPMHLAKAAGAPVLAIFGASHAGYNGPLGQKNRVAWNPVECSPCYHADEFATANAFTGAKIFSCWKGDHLCMRGLMPEQVYELAAVQIADIRKDVHGELRQNAS